MSYEKISFTMPKPNTGRGIQVFAVSDIIADNTNINTSQALHKVLALCEETDKHFEFSDCEMSSPNITINVSLADSFYAKKRLQDAGVIII